MIICSCTGATDRDIRRVATNPSPDLGDGLCSSAAGRCCGGCASKVREIVAKVQKTGLGNERNEAARS